MDVPHLCKAGHRLAVFAHRRRHDRAADRIVEASIPARDREAGGEPLHVPLEWSRQRLVEVVDAEDEPPVRCGEDAEVGEVRVAAELGVQSRPGPIREVGRHEIGAAAEKGERGHEHAPVPDRAELWKPRLRLLLEKIDRVSAHRRRLPNGVRGAGQLAARRLSPSSTLGRREVRYRSRPRRPLVRRRALVEDARRGQCRVQLSDLRVLVPHCSAPLYARWTTDRAPCITAVPGRLATSILRRVEHRAVPTASPDSCRAGHEVSPKRSRRDKCGAPARRRGGETKDDPRGRDAMCLPTGACCTASGLKTPPEFLACRRES